MASDYRAERVEPTERVAEPAHHHGRDGMRRHTGSQVYEQAARPVAHPTADDVASVLGLPLKAVTPEFIEAVAPLLAEIDRLHWHAEHAEHRVAWLERLSDRHSVAPCLTRRALVRELESFLVGGDAYGTVAIIDVFGVEALRRDHGMAAGEAAMRYICANILGSLRNTDMVGCMGGSDFAILLPGADPDNTRSKLEEIVARMQAQPLTWEGRCVELHAAFGLHAVEPGEGAEQVLAAADRARRGLA